MTSGLEWLRNRAGCEAVLDNGGRGYSLRFDDVRRVLQNVASDGWGTIYQPQVRTNTSYHCFLVWRDGDLLMAVAVMPGYQGGRRDLIDGILHSSLRLRTEPFPWPYEDEKFERCKRAFDALKERMLRELNVHRQDLGYIDPSSHSQR